ncbi:44159_t:CDS:2, partial [Gigaspora margarita]
KIMKYILSLFHERRLRIITAHGLMEEIIAGDGIDQGEVISLLIWWMFYVPLLTRVQEESELGYIVEQNPGQGTQCNSITIQKESKRHSTTGDYGPALQKDDIKPNS